MEREIVVPAADAVYMSVEAADKLLATGDGDAALLYIYILKNKGTFAPGEAAALGLKGGVAAAMDRLSQLGLVRRSVALRDRDGQPPRYGVDEIYASAKAGSGFAELVPEVESILGKSLSPAELQAFFLAFDYLGMPPEVILVLASYCMSEAERRQGPGRLPSARAIERTAFQWANDEIFTLEAAEERMKRAEAVRTGVKALASALRIGDRKLGKSEEGYLASWAEMGFDTETVLEAYDRTVLKKGSLNWPYMNSILKSWHDKGLHSMDAIRNGDGKSAADKGSGEGGEDDIRSMKRLLDKLTNGGEERR